MNTHRSRRTGLDRLVSALRQVSKYSLSGALLALTGCVPSPNLISVSPDGRFVVVPVNQAGTAVMLKDASSIIRIDLKTNDVQVIGPNRNGAFWMNVSSDVIAYGLLGDELSVMIHAGNETPVAIKNAVFPNLSSDGKFVAYSISTSNDGTLTADSRLMKHDVKTGKAIDLKLPGTAPEFSPDGKRLLFVTSDASGVTSVEIADSDGGNRKKISVIEADLPNIFKPRWIDNNTLLYRAKTKDTGDDAELFFATIDGKTEQVTANDIEDVTPIAAGKDRIVWRELAVGSTPQHGDDVLPLWVSEKKNGKWTSRELGIKALAIAMVGDDLIYASAAENEGFSLRRCNLSKPQESTDVLALIKEKVKDLPASTGGK